MIEAQAVSEPLPDRGDKPRRKKRYLAGYTRGFSLLGVAVAVLALATMPSDVDRLGLLIFGLLAGLAQLGDVELFASSRSRVSVSSVMGIACLLLFGPLAGALAHMFSGLMTAVTTTLRSQQPEKDRASWIERSAFNTSMLMISVALAGLAYVGLGGEPGHVNDPGNLLPLAAAVTVDTLSNLAILVGVISIQTGRRPARIWQQDFAWGVPINILVGLLGGGALALAYQSMGLLGVLVFIVPVLATSYSYRVYVSHSKGYVDRLEEMNRRLEGMNRHLDEVNLGLLETLAAVIDAKDKYTALHSVQVTEYVTAISQQMGLGSEEQDLVRKAALVHDIGKLGIEDKIIGKRGRLDSREYCTIQLHPAMGAEILSRVNGFHEIVPLVRHHHERWDGKGYPDGLKGEQIPLGARIITLADSLEAMLTDRPYRPNLSFRQILDEIRRCSGTQFDPQVVDAFLAVVEEKERGFFKNSAALVDREALLSGLETESIEGRYLKKSMLEQ